VEVITVSSGEPNVPLHCAQTRGAQKRPEEEKFLPKNWRNALTMIVSVLCPGRKNSWLQLCISAQPGCYGSEFEFRIRMLPSVENLADLLLIRGSFDPSKLMGERCCSLNNCSLKNRLIIMIITPF
jgi:hypothetical protein